MKMHKLASLLFAFCFLSLSLKANFDMPGDTTKDKNGTFLVLPILTFSPETSLKLGAIGVYFFRYKNAGEGTHLSTIKFPVTYTLNNQVKVRLSFRVFSDQNKHLLKGFIEGLRFPLLFYGIGPDTKDNAEETYTTQAFSFEFNYLAQIKHNIYLGLRLKRSDSKTIEVEEEGLLVQDGFIPGNRGSISTGMGIVGRFDRRNNVFNPTKGPFFEVAFTNYNSLLGGEFKFNKLQIDLRHYVRLKGNIVAFNFVTERNWGHPSFETLAFLGGGQIMRGHYEGRFRDNVLLALQVEYRIPLFRENWAETREDLTFWQKWGVVAFAGLGNVAHEFSKLTLADAKSSIGFGIRYLIKPDEGVNIRLDFGFGTQRPGFYINIREAF